VAFDPVADLDTITARVQAFYVAYYGRAAEQEGLDFWTAEYQRLEDSGVPESQILVNFANRFGDEDETTGNFPALAQNSPSQAEAAAFVNSVFNFLFDRNPEGTAGDPQTGLGFYTERVVAQVENDEPLGNIILDIMVGASGDDRQSVTNKVAAAESYSTTLQQEGADYDIAAAQDLIQNEVGPTLTVEEAEAAAVEAATSASGPATVTAAVSVADDPLFAGMADEIEATTEAALANWAELLDVPEPVTIEIDIIAVNTSSLALGGSTFYSDDRRPDGSVPSALAAELTSGEDTRPTDADARIQISRDNFDRIDFGNGGEFDGEALLTHELGHAIGFSSFRDDPEATFESVWDTFLIEDGGQYFFTGPNAVTAHGGTPVPLSGLAHLSEDEFTTALMTPTAEPGPGESLGAIEVATLQDLGLPVVDDPAAIA